MIMKTLWCLGAALFLFGCASVGHEFDITHVHDVKNGQTKADITAWFGEPVQTVSFGANPKGCIERWIYKHATAHAGGSAHAQALIVDFDPQGAVCDTAYSEVNQ
jgi:outer membrane protein assembly factor BamE (lipoprotein component of BamABCDE complex)